MNLLEKIIATVAPGMALKRLGNKKKLEILNTGYSNHGANTFKKSMLGWLYKGGSVKQDIYKNRNILVQRSRDLYMGAPLATGAIKTIATNVVGSGLKLKPTLDFETLGMTRENSQVLQNKIEKEFNYWSNCKIDQQGVLNFYQLQELVFLTTLLNGECFIKLNYFETPLNPYLLKLQIIEPDRIFTPQGKEKEYTEGVKFDSNGRIESYRISNKHPLDSEFTGKEEIKEEKIYGDSGQLNLIHVLFTERPEQVRGVPILAPIIECMKQLDRYTEAELVAAVVSGLYAVFIETDGAENGEFGEPPISEEEQVDSQDERSLELSPGLAMQLNPGEKVVSTDPGRPNTAFDPFVTAILRQIGSALEVPYELLLKHFSASYSASRAALLEAWKMFRKRREWFVSNFTQPVYEEFLREGYLNGRLELRGFDEDVMIRKAYAQSQWNGPAQGSIDPKKEAEASVIKINNGLSTRTKETAELNGGSFEQNVQLLAYENELLVKNNVFLKDTIIEKEVESGQE